MRRPDGRWSAGDLSVSVEGTDLACVTTGSRELVRRIQLTVRDRDWNTVEPDEPVRFRRVLSREGVRLVTHGAHTTGEIQLTWVIHVVIEPSRLTYEFDARATAAFDYHRIGLCALLPGESLVGGWFDVWPESGSRPVTRVPAAAVITPQRIVAGEMQPLFGPTRRVEVHAAEGARVTLEMGGEDFECEDQRNWTDDSFKLYAPPLGTAATERAARGDRYHQRISVLGPRAMAWARDRSRGGPIAGRVLQAPATSTAPCQVSVAVGALVRGRLPLLGSSLDLDQNADSALAQLASCGLDHVRIDLRPEDVAAVEQVGDLGDAARGAGIELELAVRVGDHPPTAAARLRNLLHQVPLARVIALPSQPRSGTATETASAAQVDWLRSLVPMDSPVLAGTDMNFCELNRTHPAAGEADGVAYASAAAVHARDVPSILQTPAGLAATALSAQALGVGPHTAISPLTILPLFNAVAGPDPSPAPSPPESYPDDVTAVFVLGAVARLSAVSATSVTIGHAREEGLPPETILHLLSDMCARKGFRRRAVHTANRSSPGRPAPLHCLALERGGETVLWAGNTTAHEVLVDVSPWPDSTASVFSLALAPYQIAQWTSAGVRVL